MVKIAKKISINFVLDLLLFITLIIQDTDSLRLFGTQFYKYIVILMLVLLLFNFIKNKRTIKLNKIFLVIVLLIYSYLYIFNFSKTIIVPSIFYLIEIITFMLYIQSKESKEKLVNSIGRIILFSGLFLAIFSIIQFVSFRLNIKPIYEFLTQNMFYLYEGRFSSIYTEPAHLCTIISAALFLSMYNIYNGKKKINYLFLIVLLFANLISGSVVAYVSLIMFLLLFGYVVFSRRKKSTEFDKINMKYITLVSLLIISLTFLFFEANVLSSVINKVTSLLSNNNYKVTIDLNNENSLIDNKEVPNESLNLDDVNDSKNKEEELVKEDIPSITSDTYTNTNEELINITALDDTQQLIIHTQLSNGPAYAMKSNLYIAIEKMKDKYLFGTGMFTHIVSYDKYMKRIYPDGYVRINYADACSMFIRIFSEFGIIGFVIFVGFLIYILILGIKNKDIFLLFTLVVFITQSMRLGEYNWILNCLSFVILVSSVKFSEKCYLNIEIDKILRKFSKIQN